MQSPEPSVPRAMFDDDDDVEPRKKSDSSALRILASWIAAHNGFDPHADTIVDRGFFVVEVADA